MLMKWELQNPRALVKRAYIETDGSGGVALQWVERDNENNETKTERRYFPEENRAKRFFGKHVLARRWFGTNKWKQTQ